MNARNLELVFGPARALVRSGLIWTLSISAIVFVTIAVWPAFRGDNTINDAMKNLPAGVVQAFGLQDFGSPAGFLRANLYDFFVPLLMAGAAIGFVNSVASAEEDSGRLELVLAQPAGRQAVFLGRAIAVCLWVLIVTAVTTLVQFGSDAMFDLQIGTDRLLATLALSFLLALFTGGLCLAVAGLWGKPAAVLGVGLFLAIGGCIIAALFPLSDVLKPLAQLSPWNWAFDGDPLVNATELWRYLSLGLPAIVLTVVGVWAFGRRDIAAA
jgi:ABC-2 type transport system permease protein